MKDFKILKFLDKLKGLFENLGVDYFVMRRILQVKLTLDERRVPTVTMNSSSKKKKGNRFVGSLLVYILLGCILIPFVISQNNYLFQMSFLFGILIFMMFTTLVSDFSSVLLDLRDKDIILSKPVDDKTLNVAKIIHILIYMFYVTFSFTGPALIVSLFKNGFLFFILFLIEIILMDFFIVVLTALLYLLMLKFFDGEKLKDIINYVQIILTVTLSIGYQLIGRLFDFSDIMNINFVPKWWQYLIPSMWFAGPFELIIKNNRNFHIVLFSILAFIIPILSIIIYIKLTPYFESNLQKLNNSSGNMKVRGKGLNYYLSKVICRTKDERTFFRFATNMMKKERKFKLQVYPSLGLALAFPFIFLLSDLKAQGWDAIAISKRYFNIYFIALIVPTVIMTMGHSDKYKGAWIYKAVSFKGTKDIFRGTIKAFIANFLLPMYIFQSIIFMLIFKGSILLDLIIVFLNILLFIVICFRVSKTALPFSEPFDTVNQGKGLAIIPLFLILLILAGIHYGATLLTYGRYINIAILVILNIIIWSKGFNISMEKLSQ